MLSPDEAAAFSGMSRPHFDAHVRPHLRPVQMGKRVLFDRRRIEEFFLRRSSTELGDLLPYGRQSGEDPLARRVRERRKSG